jgi:hypothetical protein
MQESVRKQRDMHEAQPCLELHTFETGCSQLNNWRNARSIGAAALNLPPPNKGNRMGRKQRLTEGPKHRAQINVNKLSCDVKNLVKDRRSTPDR